jgi:neutral ceramidase
MNVVGYTREKIVGPEPLGTAGPNLFEYGRPALRWAGDIETRINRAVTKPVKSVEK